MALNKELDQQGNFLFKYRGTLPIIILCLGLSVFCYEIWKHAQTKSGNYISTGYSLVCLAVALVGLLIRVLAVGYAQKNTSGRNTERQVADYLNTCGMYSIVRHPLYLGNFFMWLGVAMLTHNVWFIVAFTLAYCLYYERIMYAEEQFIGKKFGSKYTEWSEKTPAILPKIQNWNNPDQEFSTKKVLRQEKNGFAAIFILFFIFDAIGEYITYGNIEFRNLHWLVLCIISCVIYFVLKILKNNTDLLKTKEGR